MHDRVKLWDIGRMDTTIATFEGEFGCLSE